MKLIFKPFFLFLFFSISISSYSQNKKAPTYTQLIAKRFTHQQASTLQEKAYLQTDKPYYSAGEDIWFKGYVVNATTHIPKTLSQFLYVELIDKANTVVERVKIKKDSLGFAGHIKLKPEIPVGNYTLRAYTFWMQNAATDFFYSKSIFIGNPIDDFVSSQISYDTTKTAIYATIHFFDAVKKPIVGKTVVVNQNWSNDNKKKVSITTNKEGKITWPLAVATNDSIVRVIDATISETNLKYNKRFFPPASRTDFDLQFFPEGGNLIRNTLQMVAFKAIGKDGLSVDISGKLFSDKNEEITEFTSLHKGMGKFSLKTDSGVNYYALVKTNNGIEKRFNLPLAQPEGIALQVAYNKGKILYEFSNTTQKQNAAFYLLIHSRGKMLAMLPLTNAEGQISESLLPAGIISISVVDSLYNIYSERLCFVPKAISPTISIQADKSIYGSREPVNLTLKIDSLLAQSSIGNFSMSVTDKSTVKLDSLADNIYSNLLLCSDIKGYVEDPGSYFMDQSILSREKLDILMLTQGWRRFNLADVLKAKYKQPTYYMEAGQALSGKVINLFNKPSKKCSIIMFSPYKSMIKLSQTDSVGRYLIDGLEFPDSTSFILKAKKSKTFGDVEIISDVDEFPKSTVLCPAKQQENQKVMTDFLQQSKEKYYTEGGLRAINLSEVVVSAAKINKDEDTHYYSGMEDTKFDAQRLEGFPGMSILDVLMMMPGIQVSGDQVSIRGSSGNPMFLIDEIETQGIEEISYLTTNDVESISVFKGANAAIFGSRGGNGVIAIALKKGVILKAETPISLITVSPMGYQKPAEFYMPKYNVDSVKMNTHYDLRTTIYWNPKISTDSTGTAHVKFFTADKKSDYSIVIEGVTNAGEICRYVGYLRKE
ncbi:MAG: TonB-dependent receptor plug domain-containing protein [Paludibacter sp.]